MRLGHGYSLELEEKLFKTDRVSFPDNELSDKNWMRYVCSDQSIKEEFMEDEYYSNNTYDPLEWFF